MMWRAGDRLRASLETTLHGELDGVRNELTASFATSFEALRREIVTDHEMVEARSAEHEAKLFSTLYRVADAFEKIAEGLDADRRDCRQQLDAVEFLPREVGTRIRAADRSSAIRRRGLDRARRAGDRFGGRADIDLSESPIPVGTPVEVRSRFHDRWVHGFAVAEYVVGPIDAAIGCAGSRNLTSSLCSSTRPTCAEPRLRPTCRLPPPADHPERSMWR